MCFLCGKLNGDYRQRYTEEHHILFGAGQREIAEAEGMKVDLCPEHHRIGKQAVHNNREIRGNAVPDGAGRIRKDTHAGRVDGDQQKELFVGEITWQQGF
mgnify:CR=1 FL=1